jgi:hypothetical protein
MNVEERIQEIEEIASKLYSPGNIEQDISIRQVIATVLVAEQLESIANILKNKRGV